MKDELEQLRKENQDLRRQLTSDSTDRQPDIKETVMHSVDIGEVRRQDRQLIESLQEQNLFLKKDLKIKQLVLANQKQVIGELNNTINQQTSKLAEFEAQAKEFEIIRGQAADKMVGEQQQRDNDITELNRQLNQNRRHIQKITNQLLEEKEKSRKLDKEKEHLLRRVTEMEGRNMERIGEEEVGRRLEEHHRDMVMRLGNFNKERIHLLDITRKLKKKIRFLRRASKSIDDYQQKYHSQTSEPQLSQLSSKLQQPLPNPL